jgi:TetR/AcrR family transcriptional regulator of autoinduction and epiphytic fitness
MVEQLKQSEPVIVRWIRDAQASGRLLAEYESVELGDLLMGQVKAVALWPQIMMGQPPLDELRRQRLAEMAIRQFWVLSASNRMPNCRACAAIH